MTARQITGIVIVAVVVLLVAWDIYAAANSTPNDTVSVLMFDFAKRYPIIPFALGVVVGHWFWPL